MYCGGIAERNLCISPDTLKFIAVNRIARDNLGYTMKELHKMTPLDIKPEMERRSFKGLLAPLVGGEQEGAMFHTVQRRKDGSLYPAEVHLQLLKAQGEEAYLALIINLTERRAMEQELREREGVEVVTGVMESAAGIKARRWTATKCLSRERRGR